MLEQLFVELAERKILPEDLLDYESKSLTPQLRIP
jgi:hypothetical protein